MDSANLKSLKIILVASSLVSLLLLMLAATEEHFAGEWREHQETYRAALVARATDNGALAAAKAMDVNYQQLFLPQLNRIDRCTTCHIGINDPAMVEVAQPLRAHSGTVLQTHPVERFGCTVCHDGQGRAVHREDAHGEVMHWLEPLLRGPRVYSSCSRCHTDGDLFYRDSNASVAPDAEGMSADPIKSSDAPAGNGGAQAIRRGRKLVSQLGCLGCHKYKERGGTLGPDITHFGDKKTHDLDFTHVEGSHTPEQWLVEHFEDPARVSPDSLMPSLEIAEEQIRDLTLYMLSLHRKDLPTEYVPGSQDTGLPVESGQDLYMLFCSACHGAGGRGVEKPAPELKVPSLAHPDALAVASDEFLQTIVHHGRQDTTMIAWGDPLGGGLSIEEIERIVSFIRSWQPDGPSIAALAASSGDVERGREVYARHCAACHGQDGGGGIGTTLNSASFLAIASDGLLAHTLLDGRSNTAMPSWRGLDERQINDLLALMRSWLVTNCDRDNTLSLLHGSQPDLPGNANGDGIHLAEHANLVEAGQAVYVTECSQCHGVRGEGGLGPVLNSQEYLALTGEPYLFDAIALGRPGTSMPSYQHLSNETMAGLIALLKSWQHAPDKHLDQSQPNLGNWQVGNVLYDRLCLECHGPTGRGASSIQLANPVLAATATDSMLFEWIASGLSPSPALHSSNTGHSMPPFEGAGNGEFQYTEHHLHDLVAYLRWIQQADADTGTARVVEGDPDAGKLLYAQRCANCHAPSGEGAIGAALSNAEFLAAANDDFIVASIILGRENTEMLPAGPGTEGEHGLTEQQIRDLTAYIRGWQAQPPINGVPVRNLVVSYEDDPFVEMSVDNGRDLFVTHCAACHGEDGRGTRDTKLIGDCQSCHAHQEELLNEQWTDEDLVLHFGPRLNNPQFLAAATDGFLQATIVRGRIGTAMRSYGFDGHSRATLDTDSTKDIVIYMRSWQRSKPTKTAP